MRYDEYQYKVYNTDTSNPQVMKIFMTDANRLLDGVEDPTGRKERKWEVVQFHVQDPNTVWVVYGRLVQ